MSAEWRAVLAQVDAADGADDVLRCALPQPDVVRVAGEDAEKFLDAQLINTLPSGAGEYGYNGYCSPKGRLLCTLTVWREGDDFFLLADRGLGAVLVERLQKYVLRARVELTLVGDDLMCTGLIGGAVAAGDARLLQLPGTLPRFLLLSSAAPVGNREIAQNIWEAARIFAGVPRITEATAEKFLPQQLNMHELNGVSFNKGCYPGQEVIARLHFLGKQKTKMAHHIIPPQRAPQPGDAVTDTDGKSIGSVVTATDLPDRRVLVQVVVPLARESGLEINV